MKKLFALLLILIFGCSSNRNLESKIIRIKGSDTMLLLNKKLAEEFMKIHPDISIYVEGGGTGTGVANLLKGNIQICAASRPLEPDEIKSFGEQFSTVGMSFLIGRDALSIIINKDNPIRDLKITQVDSIFTKKITLWTQLGGFDKIIKPITRSNASGTYLYFTKHVLMGKRLAPSIPILNTTSQIIDYVSKNIDAIGYGGVGYADSTMQCSINGIKPTKVNVLNNTYPISRYLRYYTSRKPRGNIKLFIDWVMGARGQNVVKKLGYVPLWE